MRRAQLAPAHEPTSAAGSRAGANCARLMECVPASGPDLTALFGQLGLDLPPTEMKRLILEGL